jgi:hypothetical protein
MIFLLHTGYDRMIMIWPFLEANLVPPTLESVRPCGGEENLLILGCI